MIELTLPNLDDNVTDYTLVKWLKQPGQTVGVNEPVLEVETDKVTMEVVAEQAGTLTELLVRPGDTLQPGAILARLKPANSTPAAARPATAPPGENGGSARLTPVVARLVADHEIDVTQITGTGYQGRVTKKDILAYLERGQPKPGPAAPQPVQPQSGSTPAGLLPLTGMRRTIAGHMVHSVQTSPHVTTVFEFDFAAVAAHRAAHKTRFAQDGLKLTYMAYLIQATAGALKRFPVVNSVWHDEGLELKPEVNIGLIVAVEGGLLAPVIRQADQLNLRGLARAIGELSERARQGALKPGEMQGGTFTISNHGASGSLLGTPIIFQPQAGILGLGAIEDRVKVLNGGIHIRPCAYVSFSFDHRIMDGALADGFVADIKQTIENWR